MLPFTLEEAVHAPQECSTQVSPEHWEEEVIKPLLKSTYGKDPTSRRAHFDQFSCRSEESIAIESYDLSLAIARCHKAFWGSQSDKQVVDFESIWKARTPELLKERVTYALQMATNLTGDVSLRTECPDLTPALLCKDNGRRLWHIIRTIAESAVRFPLSDNYISIVSEVWDVLHEVERIDGYPKFRGSPAQKHCQVLCEHRRNYFIALFVACLCSAMSIDYVLAPPNRLLRKDHLKTTKENWIRLDSFDKQSPLGWNWRLDLSEPAGSDGVCSAKLYEVDSEHGELACRACGRFAIEVQELCDENKDELFCCSKCAKMDPSRIAAYCSPDCQAQDWKAAHRLVCGKMLINVVLKEPLSLSTSHRPLALPLLLQLHPPPWFGRDPSEYVYTFRFKLDPPPASENLPPNLIQVGFDHLVSDEPTRQILNQAVSSRSVGDVRRFVEHIIGGYARYPMSRWRRESITSQLAQEWELDARVVGDWVLSTLNRKAWVKGAEYVEISTEEDRARQVYSELNYL